MTLTRRTALRQLTALGTTASLGVAPTLSASASAGAENTDDAESETEDTNGYDETDSDHDGENANAGDSEDNNAPDDYYEVYVTITDSQTGEPIVDAHKRVGISIDGGLVPVDDHPGGELGMVLLRLADGTHNVRVASYPVWMESIVCIHVDGEGRTATVGLPGGPEYHPDAAGDPSFGGDADSEAEGESRD